MDLINRIKSGPGPRLVSIIGAGGKSTTMNRLAREAKKEGSRVLITTTTHISIKDHPYDRLIFSQDFGEEVRKGTISLLVKGHSEDLKAWGHEPAYIDSIFEKNLYDLIIVEADGSKGKGVKAWKETEPVVPKRTSHSLALLGLDTIGLEINEDNAHRSELLLELLGKNPGDILLMEDIIKLVVSPKGIFQRALGEKILILNKVDLYRGELDIRQLLEKIEKNISVYLTSLID